MFDTPLEAKLLTVKQLAAVLNLSTRTVWRMHSEGRIPPSVRLGRSVRWRRDEIDEWISAGCPERTDE